MATHSVNDVASLINNQITFHEKIQDYLIKIEALAYVALNRDFLESGQSVINEYINILYDFVTESKALHQYALNNLIRSSRQYAFVD
ncbi:MAG TPA: hypothetical protein VLJ15_03690 [Gammaproteobacteria bacterium]|nr:hypothetical protein [Gammaproteobacteria bacterium]